MTASEEYYTHDGRVEYFTIELENDEYVVYGHGEYEESSVLAGQYRRQLCDIYSTLAEAVRDYPSADSIDHSTRCTPNVPSVPYDGFDESDAGERWDENY